MPPSIMV